MLKNTTLILPYTIPPEIGPDCFSARSFIDNKFKFFTAKRILDVTISLAIILFVLSWLIPVLALLIKLDSRGPVFFRQKRVGRGVKSFVCLKFRTMYVNDDSHIKHAEKNDTRITRIGRL